MSNSKFYPKSLTLLLPILEMINEGCISRDIATRLGISKQLVFYHIKKAKESGLVTEVFSDAFKTFELTQPGKNFLAKYQNNKAGQQQPICRAENVRFKAPVYKMPSKPMDWQKVEIIGTSTLLK